MDIASFIKDVGGNKPLTQITGLTKGRISQWKKANSIPRAWVLFLQEKYPVQCYVNGISSGTQRQQTNYPD